MRRTRKQDDEPQPLLGTSSLTPTGHPNPELDGEGSDRAELSELYGGGEKGSSTLRETIHQKEDLPAKNRIRRFAAASRATDTRYDSPILAGGVFRGRSMRIKNCEVAEVRVHANKYRSINMMRSAASAPSRSRRCERTGRNGNRVGAGKCRVNPRSTRPAGHRTRCSPSQSFH
jgi:hypothetical protein